MIVKSKLAENTVKGDIKKFNINTQVKKTDSWENLIW